MPHESRYLDCCDCDQSFPFSIAQQGLYAELGYDQPTRCPSCRRSMEKSRRPVPDGEIRS
jgi:Probable zinc-ribbon domain